MQIIETAEEWRNIRRNNINCTAVTPPHTKPHPAQSIANNNGDWIRTTASSVVAWRRYRRRYGNGLAALPGMAELSHVYGNGYTL